jgi:hypothetical protein
VTDNDDRGPRRRFPIVAVVGVPLALAVIAAVFLSSQTDGHGHVIVAAGTTTTVIGHPENATPTDAPTGPALAPSGLSPDDGRLHQPYATAQYRPGSAGMDSWRMDPAPASLASRLSAAQALALFRAINHVPGDANATTVVRFGLFTGNEANPPGPPPNHPLTGSHPVGPLPAWIVLVDGIQMGPAAGPPEPSTTVPTAPLKGHAMAVISDQDGHDLFGVLEVGGESAASTGIQ